MDKKNINNKNWKGNQKRDDILENKIFYHKTIITSDDTDFFKMIQKGVLTDDAILKSKKKNSNRFSWEIAFFHKNAIETFILEMNPSTLQQHIIKKQLFETNHITSEHIEQHQNVWNHTEMLNLKLLFFVRDQLAVN